MRDGTAAETTADYCKVPVVTLPKMRRILYEAVQLVTLLVVVTPFPLWFHSFWTNVSDDYQETIGIVAIGTTVTLLGIIVGLLFAALALPRLFSLVLKPVDDDTMSAALSALRVFAIGASWGGTRSLVAPQAIAPDRTATAWTAKGPLLRISIGLEDQDDLWNDLDALLVALEQPAAAKVA